MTISLIRYFLNFINKIKQSPIAVLRNLYSIAKADVRTTTAGSNHRNILLQTSLSSVDVLQPDVVKQLKHMEIKDRDMWRIPIIKEAMDIRSGDIDPPDGLTRYELEEILHVIFSVIFILLGIIFYLIGYISLCLCFQKNYLPCGVHILQLPLVCIQFNPAGGN